MKTHLKFFDLKKNNNSTSNCWKQIVFIWNTIYLIRPISRRKFHKKKKNDVADRFHWSLNLRIGKYRRADIFWYKNEFLPSWFLGENCCRMWFCNCLNWEIIRTDFSFSIVEKLTEELSYSGHWKHPSEQLSCLIKAQWLWLPSIISSRILNQIWCQAKSPSCIVKPVIV